MSLAASAMEEQPKPVTLALFVHDGSQNGPIIPDAQVTANDGSGNSVQQTTDSSGYAEIRGDSGSWSLTASADGYMTETWRLDIHEDNTKHVFLKEANQQESISSNTPITLIVFVHDGTETGPTIADAQVTAKDVSGNSFQQNTSSDGNVIFTGYPGTWNFEILANGYNDDWNTWDQPITSDYVIHKSLSPIDSDHKVPAAAPLEAWVKTFGGSGDQEAYSIQQTDDGGYIITGTNQSGPNPTDVWLIKTDESGSIVWDRTFDHFYANDCGNEVQQTNDGGYIIAASTRQNQDAWLIKTDEAGNMVWDRIFEGAMANSVQQTTDGGYIIGGSTAQFGAGWWDIWLVKTDNNGNEVWNRTFGTEHAEIGYSVRQTTDGGYIIVGESDDENGLIKTDTNGNVLWKRELTGKSIKQTNDGGYIIVGDNSRLIKTDSEGNVFWNLGERCLSVQETNDGGFVATNLASTIRTDRFGKTLWIKSIGGRSIEQTSDGGYIIAGGRKGSGDSSDRDVWLIKIDSDSSIVSTALDSSSEYYANSEEDNTSQNFSLEFNANQYQKVSPEDEQKVKTQPEFKEENAEAAKSSGFAGILTIVSLLCILVLRRKK